MTQTLEAKFSYKKKYISVQLINMDGILKIGFNR